MYQNSTIYWLAGHDIHQVSSHGERQIIVQGHPFSQVGISSVAFDPSGKPK